MAGQMQGEYWNRSTFVGSIRRAILLVRETEGRMKKLFASVALAGILAAGVAHADAIADRKALMKANGGAMGVLAKTAKGEMAFDAAAVAAAFKALNDSTKTFGDMFPKGSETGGETTVAPKLFEDMAGFKTALAKFAADTDAAVKAAPATKEAFMAVFGPVAGNCKSCHEVYRLPPK
jgi:cytochrome c556